MAVPAPKVIDPRLPDRKKSTLECDQTLQTEENELSSSGVHLSAQGMGGGVDQKWKDWADTFIFNMTCYSQIPPRTNDVKMHDYNQSL